MFYGTFAQDVGQMSPVFYMFADRERLFGIIEAMRRLYPDQYFELVHRLARETSGCLVIAKSREALRHIQELLKTGSVEKRYLTLVRGRWSHGEHLVDEPLPRKVGSHSHRGSAVSKPRKEIHLHSQACRRRAALASGQVRRGPSGPLDR